MTIQKIEQSVTNSATHEAEQIVKAAQSAVSERLEAERESARRNADQRYESAVRAIDDEMARSLLQARGAANKQLLERRNEVLRRLFDRARDAVLAWPTDVYSDVVGRHLAKAAGEQGGVLRIHPQDREAFNKALSALNAARAGSARITIDEDNPLPARGGFVFVTDAYEVDRTLDTILGELEHELAPEIAAELFKGTVA